MPTIRKGAPMTEISSTPQWKTLEADAAGLARTSMRELFEGDADRFARYSIDATGLFLDYSKNKLTDEVVEHLLALAVTADVEGRRKAMFAGEAINTTEDRAVLHVALRAGATDAYSVAGEDVSVAVRAELNKMKGFCKRVHQGAFKGYSGKALDTVVNIGIGGSDLGPQMATAALQPFWIDGRRTFFVSNVDGQHLADALDACDPERTLFIIASKIFTTQETMANATSARAWFLENGGGESDIAKHFIALSTNAEAVAAFGIDSGNMFQFWDWVGGRYSLWSAIGLSIALQVGFSNFEKLLAGARRMDEHFKTAPLAQNMPVMLALTGVWNRNFIGASAHAILPYDQHLARLPAYLQQADMESNGKRVARDGAVVAHATGPVLFGEPGTNGQHAFYQLLHQGTDIISADFIAPAFSQRELGDHHQILLSNFLAQTEALMRGKTQTEVRDELRGQGKSDAEIDALSPHKVFPGDRPTNSILMERLDPETLGSLIALYEHKIFVEGVIWGINSFDQWGVELGKVLAREILPEIAAAGEAKPQAKAHDTSTNGLIDKINAMRGKAK
jgi:glucose-6-phosphate isomerase